jgi:hypothetical protein
MLTIADVTTTFVQTLPHPQSTDRSMGTETRLFGKVGFLAVMVERSMMSGNVSVKSISYPYSVINRDTSICTYRLMYLDRVALSLANCQFYRLISIKAHLSSPRDKLDIC